MKGARDVELHRAQPQLTGGGGGSGERLTGSRQHDLLWRVVIGHRQPMSRGQLVRVFGRTRTEQGEHSAIAGLHAGLLHETTTLCDQL